MIVDYAQHAGWSGQRFAHGTSVDERSGIAVFGRAVIANTGQTSANRGSFGAAWADWLIITADDPRSEDPWVICEEIRLGVKEAGFPLEKAPIIVERRRAVREAIAMAKDGDVILIAGKGRQERTRISRSHYSI